MFGFLKKRLRRSHYRICCIPEGWRVYAIGDIHGRADLLACLHQLIRKDAERQPPTQNLIVYLGDYIDRGLQVYEVLNLLVTGESSDFEAVFLRGNHEELMLHFLEDATHLETWIAMGGQATLMNYRVRAPGSGFGSAEAREVRNALEAALPESHCRFLNQLATSFTLGDYFFAHAGVRPGVSLAQQNPQDLLWIRDEFLASAEFHGARVVHGHSIAARPEIQPNRIGVDTGAFASGVLSAVVLEGDQVRLLQATARDLRRLRRAKSTRKPT